MYLMISMVCATLLLHATTRRPQYNALLAAAVNGVVVVGGIGCLVGLYGATEWPSFS